MTDQTPAAELTAAFSSPEASAVPWAEGRRLLEQAELFWLSTVRPDGRPHVTPLIAVWLDQALYFCTGAGERKAKNLVENSHCVLTTGCNALRSGFDVVVEGVAERVADQAQLQRIADAYERKYGSEWRFAVEGDTLKGAEGNIAVVYAVAPVTAFGFGKGEPYSQTAWRWS